MKARTSKRTPRCRTADLALAGLLSAFPAVGCRDDGVADSWLDAAVTEPTSIELDDRFQVPPPPFSEDIFPCSDCHDPDIPVSHEPRRMKMEHTDIVLGHAEESRWCLDCHDATDRDHLRLANGELVPFEESYRLCGQCHGTVYRDWRAGIHGRRTGRWDGAREYLLCVHCHNAHAPQFPPLEPEPAPVRPERTP